MIADGSDSSGNKVNLANPKGMMSDQKGITKKNLHESGCFVITDIILSHKKTTNLVHLKTKFIKGHCGVTALGSLGKIPTIYNFVYGLPACAALEFQLVSISAMARSNLDNFLTRGTSFLPFTSSFAVWLAVYNLSSSEMIKSTKSISNGIFV